MTEKDFESDFLLLDSGLDLEPMDSDLALDLGPLDLNLDLDLGPLDLDLDSDLNLNYLDLTTSLPVMSCLHGRTIHTFFGEIYSEIHGTKSQRIQSIWIVHSDGYSYIDKYSGIYANLRSVEWHTIL
jgi:hypothetical protein